MLRLIKFYFRNKNLKKAKANRAQLGLVKFTFQIIFAKYIKN